MKANRAQIIKIHALKSRLGLSEDDYRNGTLASFGVSSSKDLTTGQANELINKLSDEGQKMGVWNKKKKKYDHLWGRPTYFASPAQLRKIEAMWKNVSIFSKPKERADALDTFINRIVGVMGILSLEKAHVEKVVKAIESMKQ